MSDDRGLRRLLTASLAKQLGVDAAAIDALTPLGRYGLESVQAAAWMTDVERELGRPLPATLVYECPTIEALVEALDGHPERTPGPTGPASDLRFPNEPVAIVGLSCRFPGAPHPGAFWDLLRAGGQAITAVPPDRWEVDHLYDPDAQAVGKMSTRWGGFLDHVDRFDATFFGISPREAVQMDPQQRLLLELAYETLDDAGHAAGRLRGSRTGVFIGAMWADYVQHAVKKPTLIDRYTATGQDTSVLSARLSYQLGTRGPSLTVNTACSSSLVAVHLACQSLRVGESTLALAGGVNLILAPEPSVAMSKFGGLAPDGRCKAFADGADGYVRGEGGGMVLLKPYRQALADGDSIYALLLGTGTNNDGVSAGLSAPSPAAQSALLRDVYSRAGLSPQSVDYVEAHGTGTALGDPIEAAALGSVLGVSRAPERRLRLGSVKTNIGHLEAAAGMAGLIKVALALQHEELPPSLNCERLNPQIAFDRLGLTVQRERTAWPVAGHRPTAGVSSFGFGGSNAHAVLQAPARRARLLALAGDSPAAVWSRAAELRAQLEADPSGDRADAICAMAARVGDRPYRRALVGRSATELMTALRESLDTQSPVVVVDRLATSPPRPVFVFSGNGSPWPGMGRALFPEPAFRAKLEECDEALTPRLGWSVVERLSTPDPLGPDGIGISPLLFAFQVSLAALWASWGVRPGAVMGHSVGEVAAACVAGIVSLPDAALLVAERSRAQQRVGGRGSMAVVELPRSEVERHLGTESRLTVAAVNGPRTTLVAGETAAVTEFTHRLEDRGVPCHPVHVDVAGHTAQVDEILPAFLEQVATIQTQPGLVTMISTVEARPLPGDAYGPRYWARNLREPVRFADATDYLIRQGSDLFVEISPHPILVEAMADQLSESSPGAGQALACVRRDDDDGLTLTTTLATLWSAGVTIDLQACCRPPVAWAGDASGFDEGHGNESGDGPAPVLLPLSAHRAASLTGRVRQVLADLDRPGVSIDDLAYTAGRRTHHEWRIAIAAADRSELRRRLERLSFSEESGDRQPGARPSVVFVFPGQGPQWVGMGHELFSHERVFRDAIRECDDLFRPFVPWSVSELLDPAGSSDQLDRVDVVQPVLFALQVGLARLWESWGICPAAVVGHSLGEVAAAHVGGALSLADGARVACLRSQLLARIRSPGSMAVVELPVDRVRLALGDWSETVSVAAINGPTQTVVVGEASALERWLTGLEREDVACHRLRIDVPAHSPRVDEIAPQLGQALEGVSALAPRVPCYSTVTGRPVEGPVMDGSYWTANLRRPVDFVAAVERLGIDGYIIFLEISPHPTLLAPLAETLEASGARPTLLASLRRHEPERRTLLETLGSLYGLGAPVNWAALTGRRGRLVRGEPYPWDRQRHWLSDATRGDRPAPRQPYGDGLCRLAWDPAPVRSTGGHATTPVSGAWMILGDPGGLGTALATRVRDGGGEATIVRRRPAFEREESGRYGVRPEVAEDLSRVFRERPPDLVIHLWGLEEEDDGGLSTGPPPGADPSDCRRLLAVLREMARGEGGAQRPRLWIVTRGVQPVVDPVEAAGLAQAPLWGLARTVAGEMPEHWGGIIDLDAVTARRTRESPLYQLIAESGGEDQIVLRGDSRYVARLHAARLTQPRPAGSWCSDASYLITGGLGHLGLLVARRAVQGGARTLILAGRQGRTAMRARAGAEAVRELERLGATILTPAVDVADEGALRRVLQPFLDGREPPLRGVVHAAGVLDQRTLLDLTPDSLEAVWRPKVLGSWTVHRLTALVELDFFVLFSSFATLLSSPGLGGYAAANAFLDALAHHRRATGLPALVVNWGFWRDSGMAARQGWTGDLAPRASGSLDPERGLEILDALMAGSDAQVGVAPIDWPQWAAWHPLAARAPILSRLIDLGPAAPEMAARASSRRSVAPTWSLDAVGQPDRRARLEHHLRVVVADVLGMTPAGVQGEKPLRSQGLDSLMTVELRRRIESDLGVLLAPSDIWNYPTLTRLAARVEARWTGSPRADAPGPPAGAAGSGAGAPLSEEDLVGLLAEELDGVPDQAD